MTTLAVLVAEYTADLSDLQRGNQQAIAMVNSFASTASGPAKVGASFSQAASQVATFTSQADAANSSSSSLATAQAKAAEAAKRVDIAEAQAAVALQRANDMALSGKASSEQIALAQERAALAGLKVNSAEISAATAMERVNVIARQEATALADDAASASKAALSLDDMASKTNQAESASKGFHVSLGSLGAKILEVGNNLNGTVNFVKGFIDSAIQMGSSLLTPAANMQQVESSLTLFTGSVEKARKEMGDLSTFSAKTPFETKAIDEAALKMQGIGISANDVIPYITSLGDALDASNKTSAADLDQIVSNFDKIKTNGHLTTEVMQSFADMGVDAWGVLEKQTGKTHAQLADLISKGLYPANAAMKDLTVGIEANPLYKGQMANDSDVLNGSISTLKSTWDQLLGSFGSPVVKVVTEGVKGLTDVMNSPAVKKFADDMGGKVASALTSVGNFAHDIAVPAFNDLKNVLKSPEFASFVGKLGELGNTLSGSVGPGLTDTKPKVDSLFNFIQKTALPALTNLVSGLNDTVKWFKENGTTAGVTAGILTALFVPAIIKTGVESTIASVKIGVQYVQSIIKTGIEGWKAAGQLALFVGNIIKTGVEAVVAGAKVAASFVANLVKSGTEAVVAGAKITATFVASIVKTGVEAAIAGIKVAATFVVSLVQAGIQAAITAGTFVATLIPSIISFAAEALIAATTAIPAILAGFGAWIVAAAGVAIANIIAFWPIYLIILVIVVVIGLVVLAIMHWGEIAGWLQGVWGALGAFFGGLWAGIVSVWGNVGKWFQDRWKQVSDGFHNAMGGLRDFAVGVWNSITGSVRSAFNWIIDQVNGVISHVNSINVAGFGVHIDMIPHLAKGSDFTQAGLTLVGEQGPELVNMPRGAQVFPNALTMSMLGSQSAPVGPTPASTSPSRASSNSGSSGGQDSQTVIIQLDGREIGRFVNDFQKRELRAQAVVRK